MKLLIFSATLALCMASMPTTVVAVIKGTLASAPYGDCLFTCLSPPGIKCDEEVKFLPVIGPTKIQKDSILAYKSWDFNIEGLLGFRGSVTPDGQLLIRVDGQPTENRYFAIGLEFNNGYKTWHFIKGLRSCLSPPGTIEDFNNLKSVQITTQK